MDEINKNKGIWKYKEMYAFAVPDQYQLTLGEGSNPLIPQPELAAKIGFSSLFLKMESQNPTGSHKDRGLAYQISYYINSGVKEFVISSSGNSSISAAALLQNRPEKLTIFLSEKAEQTKLNRLNKYIGNSGNITTVFTKRPVSQAFQYAKKTGATLLRGSTDRIAPEGYKSIAFELIDSEAIINNIILPCSSGTTTSGIYKGYEFLGQKCPTIHVVQTEFVHPIADNFDKNFQQKTSSIAKAIVDRVAHRQNEVNEILIKTGGKGWIVSDEEILSAQQLLSKYNIECSNEGAMTIAAIFKANVSGLKLDNSVCIITGVK